MAASLGATTYTSVVWTAGDMITEAKLDAMVANDQAYDSHTAQGLQVDNNKSFAGKNVAGTALNLLKIDGSDVIILGDGNTTVKKICTVVLQIIDGPASVSVGDGMAYFTIPEEIAGMNLISVHAKVVTAGTTNTTDIQIRNVTDSVDILSTKLTIDSAETGSDTAATPAVIDTSKDDVALNDLLAIDIDAVSTTAPKGLIVRLRFALP